MVIKMTIIDIITKKKDKKELNYEEIKYAVEGYINGEVKGKKLFYIKELLDRENYKDEMDDEF